MPQDDLFNGEWPVTLVFRYHEDRRTHPNRPARLSMMITGSNGTCMASATQLLPPSWEPQAAADVCKATYEAYEASTPAQTELAFLHACREWREAAESLLR